MDSVNRSEDIAIQTRRIFITFYIYIRSAIFSETVPYIYIIIIMYIIIYIIIWDSFHENGPSFIYIKCYKNASRLNCYIFRTVKGINFLFSTLHTIAFVYRKIHFGVLHLLRISTATFDTPPGSNPP